MQTNTSVPLKRGQAQASSTSKVRKLAGMEASWVARSPSKAEEVVGAGECAVVHVVSECGNTNLGRDDFNAALRSSRDRLAALARFVHLVNALPEPLSGRGDEVGQLILPLILWNFAYRVDSLSGNDAKLYQQHARTHTDLESSQVQYSIPSWLLGLQDVISIAVDTKALPGMQAYLAASPSMAQQLAEINQRIKEKQKDVEEATALNNRTNAAATRKEQPPPNTYATRIANFQQESVRINGEIPPLFEALTDVEPKDVPEVLQGIGAKVSLSKRHLEACLNYCSDLELLLLSALTPEHELSKRGNVVRIPQILSDSTIKTQDAAVPIERVQELMSDGDSLVQLVYTYLASRAMLRSMLPTLTHFPEHECLTEQIRETLSLPFSRDSRGVEGLERLLTLQDPACRDATLALLSDKISLAQGRVGEWGHSLEDLRTFRPLAWTIKHYLGSLVKDEGNPYIALLEDSAELHQNQSPFLHRVKNALDAKNFELLARAISEEIRGTTPSDSVFRLLAPLLVAEVLTGDPELCSPLRSQIPEAASLLDIGSTVQRLVPAFAPHASEIAARALKGLAVSMVDYYQDPGMVDLWEMVERFKVLIRHPEASRGLPGDKLMKSGICLKGPFGAGKTYLVDCIANELGVKKEELSAETAMEGKDGTSHEMLAICRKAVEAVETRAKQGEALIFFVDEGEGVMFNRDDPRCDSGQYQVTDFMLRAISRIRVQYPRVLIIIATNRPDKIDRGIFRPGRIDIHVDMFEPGPKVREGMIRGTLAEQKVKLNLRASEIAELVQLTDGMMPLDVNRPIVELNVIDRLLAQDSGRSFVFDYQTLRSRYEREAKDLKRRSEEARKAEEKWQRIAASERMPGREESHEPANPG